MSKPVAEAQPEAECECPVVEIQCRSGQVSDADMRLIADRLNAQVSRLVRIGGEIGTSTIWGKHRDDCPAHLDYPKRLKRYAAKLKEIEQRKGR